MYLYGIMIIFVIILCSVSGETATMYAHRAYNAIVLILCIRTREQQLVAVETKAIDP